LGCSKKSKSILSEGIVLFPRVARLVICISGYAAQAKDEAVAHRQGQAKGRQDQQAAGAGAYSKAQGRWENGDYQ
jgi:hypothetical protein